MITIYKYKLSPPRSEPQSIYLPEGAQLLSVGMQGNWPYVWARVDSEASTQRRRFYIAATGERLREEADWDFVGHLRIPLQTMDDGSLAEHLEFFVLVEPPDAHA